MTARSSHAPLLQPLRSCRRGLHALHPNGGTTAGTPVVATGLGTGFWDHAIEQPIQSAHSVSSLVLQHALSPNQAAAWGFDRGRYSVRASRSCSPNVGARDGS